jgi:uncharacterized protein (DUF2267 family)
MRERNGAILRTRALHNPTHSLGRSISAQHNARRIDGGQFSDLSLPVWKAVLNTRSLRESTMSATGLEVFDKTVHTTNRWLQDIMNDIGPDRHVAWHVLGAVLRTLRDRLPLTLAAHLGSQLPMLIRGTYYDQWNPAHRIKDRSLEEFLNHVKPQLANIRPVNTRVAVETVFKAIATHVPEGQVRKVRDSLPADLRELWPIEAVVIVEEEPAEESVRAE